MQGIYSRYYFLGIPMVLDGFRRFEVGFSWPMGYGSRPLNRQHYRRRSVRKSQVASELQASEIFA